MAASIGLGLASILFEWSGLPLEFAGVELSITIYPPLVLCLFWVLWFGFWWGFIPAYLATLVLALYSGMPLGWSLLFAFADPLGLAVFAIAYRTIPISFRLRSPNSILTFILLSFVSGIIGSTGSFIWSHTNSTAALDLLPIWQGWWIGAFLQNTLLVAPLLALLSPAVLRWRNSHRWARQTDRSGHSDALITTATILGGVLLYLHVTIKLSVWQLEYARDSNNIQHLQQTATMLAESVYAAYWILTIIVIFFAIFGYQAFLHWSDSLKRTAQELRTTNATLELLSRTDPLTGLFNRRTWEQLIDMEFQQAVKTARPGTLILMDVDNFKFINDTYGHPAGDEVLRDIAGILKQQKRNTDIAGRYGGEEFILILPNTDRDEALKLAERLRCLFEKSRITIDQQTIQFTISLGLATIDDTVGDHRAWLAQADQALYQAKRGGRNNTVFYRNAWAGD